MFYIGADHRGFELKEEIKKYLSEKEIEFVDKGTFSKEISHYPVIAKEVSSEVIKSKDNMGILICSSGVGMTIAANKFKGVRAATVINEDMAKEAKAHSNINVLVLPADYVSVSQAVNIVRAWIATEVMGGRYQERVQMIEEIEKENMK
ncbi:MAG: ribose 5-phosphate isomerase B [Clostridia bacterium]|nr:ribose 5-phosphate isomerase B [Clostridia bacterium]